MRRRRQLGIGDDTAAMASTPTYLDPALGVRAELLTDAERGMRWIISDCIEGFRCRLARPFDRVLYRTTLHIELLDPRPAVSSVRPFSRL